MLKRILPASILRLYSDLQRNVIVMLLRAVNRRKSVREVFIRIYEQNEWGGVPGEYSSGNGSTEHYATIYGNMVKEFVRTRDIHHIVDLGCGDFVVGRKLQTPGVKYLGVDIVDAIVERNRILFANTDISFQCLNIIADTLPNADLCLIRQVLQHLSNSQIAAILTQIKKYRYVIITEHYPAPSVRVVPNKDKPHGSDTRVYDNSAVYLDQPPFNLKISKTMLDVDAVSTLVNPGERITAFLIENEPEYSAPIERVVAC